MTGEIQDLALIERCISPVDPGAWEVFVRTYSRPIWSAVHKTFRNSSFYYSREDIEDVFNGVFLSLLENDFRKLRQFRSRNACTLSTWLTVVSVNAAIDYIRREAKRSSVLSPDCGDDDAAAVDQRHNVEMHLMEQQSDFALCKALDGLPKRDREVYELLYKKGMVPDAAASHLGISVSSLYTIKHRLITRLKKILLDV